MSFVAARPTDSWLGKTPPGTFNESRNHSLYLTSIPSATEEEKAGPSTFTETDDIVVETDTNKSDKRWRHLEQAKRCLSESGGIPAL